MEGSLDAKDRGLTGGWGALGVLPPTCQEQPQGFQKSYSSSCPLSSLD